MGAVGSAVGFSLVNLLSRAQFGFSALVHFIFVDLTLGLGLIIAITETMYVRTGKELWRKITKFWGTIFGLNFAAGAALGLPLEFQFGTNWAYYSHYVGDIFGSILAMEGLIAFFLESTLLGIFFFGWDLVGKRVHLLCTWLLFIGSNLSALFILIANGWMQHPIGASFRVNTMRMELDSFSEIFFSVVAQCKLVHTLYSGYVYGSMVIIAISSYYLLKGKNLEFAKKNIMLGSVVGVLSSIALVITGDSSGYVDAKTQPMKVAAIEAEWKTHTPPADLTLLGWPDVDQMTTRFAIKIPKILGIIATRSLDKEVLGIEDVLAKNKERVKNGIVAARAIEELQAGHHDAQARLEKHISDYGYALLLRKYRTDIINATQEEIDLAARDTIPNVPLLFWLFRIMVGLGFSFVGFLLAMFWLSIKGRIGFNSNKWLLRLACASGILPLVAAECGWAVAEMGRQPWSITDVLPTIVSGSAVPAVEVAATFSVMVVLYLILIVVMFFFMFKHIARADV